MQCIALWTRAAGLFQRSNSIGPLLHMIINMIWDIAYFLVLLVVIVRFVLFSNNHFVKSRFSNTNPSKKRSPPA